MIGIIYFEKEVLFDSRNSLRPCVKEALHALAKGKIKLVIVQEEKDHNNNLFNLLDHALGNNRKFLKGDDDLLEFTTISLSPRASMELSPSFNVAEYECMDIIDTGEMSRRCEMDAITTDLGARGCQSNRALFVHGRGEYPAKLFADMAISDEDYGPEGDSSIFLEKIRTKITALSNKKEVFDLLNASNRTMWTNPDSHVNGVHNGNSVNTESDSQHRCCLIV